MKLENDAFWKTLDGSKVFIYKVTCNRNRFYGVVVDNEDYFRHPSNPKVWNKKGLPYIGNKSPKKEIVWENEDHPKTIVGRWDEKTYDLTDLSVHIDEHRNVYNEFYKDHPVIGIYIDAYFDVIKNTLSKIKKYSTNDTLFKL